jgi:hypothetical protein
MAAVAPGWNETPPASSSAEKLPEAFVSAADWELDHLIGPTALSTTPLERSVAANGCSDHGQSGGRRASAGLA